MKKPVVFLFAFLGGITLSQFVVADEPKKADVEVSSEARFRLRDDLPKPEQSAVEVVDNAAVEIDTFAWSELTESGHIVAGKNPIIGKGSNKPFWSFPDGQAEPLLIEESDS